MMFVEANDTLAFATLRDVESFVARFEHATLEESEWNHRAHLTVAAWYLLRDDEARATENVVSGILHFNRVKRIERTRTSGYHETLTLFWLAVLGSYVRRLPLEMSTLEKINRSVARYGTQLRLVLDYYSPERIWSWEARLAWMEPDLQSLDAEHGVTSA